MLSATLALVAALIAWGYHKTKHPVFLVPEKYHVLEMGAPDAKVQALKAQQFRVDRLNTALLMAVLGGPLALAVAMGAHACCAAWTRALVALPWGVLWGAGTGFLAAMAIQRFTLQAEPTVTDAVREQSILFGILGAGIGLLIGAFGGSVRSLAAGLVGGAATGACAAVLFSIIVSLAMPTVAYRVFVPTGQVARLLWLGIPCVCLGYALPIITSQKKSSAPASGAA
jgi:hypothetical protein